MQLGANECISFSPRRKQIRLSRLLGLAGIQVTCLIGHGRERRSGITWLRPAQSSRWLERPPTTTVSFVRAAPVKATVTRLVERRG